MTSGATRRYSVLFVALLGALVVSGQPQTFDSYSYEAPAGYNQRSHPQMMEWSKIDQRRRSYCQIGLYRAQNSVGSPAQDMDNEWQAVVTKQFRVTSASANKEIPLPNAPTSLVRGAEAIDGNGNKTVSSLFVLRFPGRYVGVMFNASNGEAFQACQEDVTKVVFSLRLNGAATPAAPTPAAAPVVVSSGGVTGTWERIIATTPAMKYNMFTKQYEYDTVRALNQFRQVHRFRFEANGQYTYELDAHDFNRAQRTRVIERGAYSLSNGTIQFQPRELRDGVGPKDQDPPLTVRATPAAHARRFLLGPHPQSKDSVGLQLGTTDGGFETYKPIR